MSDQTDVLQGTLNLFKDVCRDVRGTAILDTLVRDTRDGIRRLVRDWRSTVAAVLILWPRHRRHNRDVQPGSSRPSSRQVKGCQSRKRNQFERRRVCAQNILRRAPLLLDEHERLRVCRPRGEAPDLW